jgi:hypothetical protein
MSGQVYIRLTCILIMNFPENNDSVLLRCHSTSTVLDVSKKRGLFVNTIRQSKNSLLDPEDEGLKILRNPVNNLAVGTA